jgi:hypothetical protein
MLKLGAQSYSEKLDAGRNSSLNIEGDRDIRAKIAMANDGYGRAVVTGTIDDSKKTVRTDRNPTSELAPDDSQPPARIIQALRAGFARIFDRFTK